ncbi:tRNA lysidine(34) synthetase TilS [Pannus brasiliensis CCIBt3594]|uniref:tRNA(Ile)-lysidine synthase n=1 Tax=Pannus brasiliensis CCIBt3594 TaxID=1427578 RepID=A0AAW9QWC2_9CHRO
MSSHPSPIWTPLHARLQETLRKRALLPRGARLLLAVSGGQDSLCLGRLLLDLQPKWRWEIAIGHCDHRWSHDVGLADHVRQLAESWRLPFFLENAPPGPETEARAREWRYGALTAMAVAGGFDRIVTGHTLSDRAETFLYHLARGAGAEGLSSLTWQRPLGGDRLLVRPLLNVSRAETGEFCRARDLPIRSDRANENLRYARNRVRRELVPYLRNHLNRQIERHLARTAEILEGEDEYLDTIASGLFEESIDRGDRSLDRSRLRSVPLALQRRVIRKFLQDYLPSSPDFDDIEAVTNLIDAPNLGQTSTLRGRLVARATGGRIELLDLRQK